MQKVCLLCQKPKDLEEFHNSKNGVLGKDCYCKRCRSRKGKRNYRKTRIKRLENQKEWKKNNPKKVKKMLNKWRDKHREHYRTYQKNWRKKNKEKKEKEKTGMV